MLRARPQAAIFLGAHFRDASAAPLGQKFHQSGRNGPRRVVSEAKGPEDSLRDLYPSRPSTRQGHINVSKLHTLYYEEYGNPVGPTALVLHGGPGAGCFPRHACFFDQDFWHVVLMDQRGCGKSTPRGCLIDNNTQSLVEDVEALRRHLGIEQWGLLFGGSWGSTLALAYGIKYPDRVQAFILRGVCLMRRKEIDWMYGGGAGRMCPEGWSMFLSPLSKSEREDPLTSYYWRLLSDDPKISSAAALSWQRWEWMAMSVSTGSEPTVISGTRPTRRRWVERWKAFREQRKKAQMSRTEDGRKNGKTPVLSPNGLQNTQRSISRRPSAASKPTWQQRSTNVAIPYNLVQPLLECHYAIHGGFLDDSPILENVCRCRDIPCVAVQGRLDCVCPPETAYQLHEAWPEMELRVVPMAGHSMYSPGIKHELLESTDVMKLMLSDSSHKFITLEGGRTL